MKSIIIEIPNCEKIININRVLAGTGHYEYAYITTKTKKLEEYIVYSAFYNTEIDKEFIDKIIIRINSELKEVRVGIQEVK